MYKQHRLILVGAGEMGGVFARGFLRTGYTITPVSRNQSMAECANQNPQVDAVLIAVGEKDLSGVLADIPAQWSDRLILLQNELLPKDWQQFDLATPTIISVWFEKKPGQDAKVIIPSPIHGPLAQITHDALAKIDIPVKRLDNQQQLLNELVLKNLYIITTNVAGLQVGGTVGDLWSQHQKLAREIANEVLDIQEYLTNQTFNRPQIIDGMVKCFDGDPLHKCMGRSAPARLSRALQQAKDAELTIPTLQSIADLL